MNDFGLSQQEANGVCSADASKLLTGDILQVENVNQRLQELNKLESLLYIA
jgi:hypothetical protein